MRISAACCACRADVCHGEPLHLADNAEVIADLFPGLAGASRAGDGLVETPAALWAGRLADALAALAGGRGEQARDHLVAL